VYKGAFTPPHWEVVWGKAVKQKIPVDVCTFLVNNLLVFIKIILGNREF